MKGQRNQLASRPSWGVTNWLIIVAEMTKFFLSQSKPFLPLNVSTVSTNDIQHRNAVPSDSTQAREVFPSRGISATPLLHFLFLSLQA